MATYEQPSQATDPVLTHETPASAKWGTGDTGTPDFFVKVIKSRFRHWNPLTDFTGDGDSEVTFIDQKMLHTVFNVTGAMIASQAMGIANLVDSNKNPVAGVVFEIGGTRLITMTAYIEEIDWVWDKRSAFVGVAMRGKGSAVAATEAAT